MKLMHLNSDKVKMKIEEGAIGVLVIGSIEHHGAQCPLGTDFIIPSYIGEKISEREDILLLPGLPYGVCPTIMDYPGTIDIGHDNLLNLIRSIIDAMTKFGMKKFIFINGHGGNIAVLDRIGIELNNKGCIGAILDWWLIAPQINNEYAGGHGDIQETSAVMAILPETVDLSLSKPQVLNQLSNEITSKYISNQTFKNVNVKIHRNLKEVVPNGWIGPFDPINSTAELGEKMLNDVIEYTDEFIDAFKKLS